MYHSVDYFFCLLDLLAVESFGHLLSCGDASEARGWLVMQFSIVVEGFVVTQFQRHTG